MRLKPNNGHVRLPAETMVAIWFGRMIIRQCLHATPVRIWQKNDVKCVEGHRNHQIVCVISLTPASWLNCAQVATVTHACNSRLEPCLRHAVIGVFTSIEL